MKKKKINKKLRLGKATIAHLGNQEMRGVQGGETEFIICQESEKACSVTSCPVTWPGVTCIETCTLCVEC